MTLNTTQKILLGIFTCLPFLLVPYIIYEVFHFVVSTIQNQQAGNENPATIITAVLTFITPILFLSFLSLVLLIIYLVHALRNTSINNTEKIIWIILFLFLGIIALPVYWIMRIWNQPETRY